MSDRNVDDEGQNAETLVDDDDPTPDVVTATEATTSVDDVGRTEPGHDRNDEHEREGEDV